MKIILNNFRCYSGVTEVEFDDTFTRIAGPSGSGKSTLVDAILFAIEGKMRNCGTLDSAKSYEVDLYWDNFHIHRTRNSLLFTEGKTTACDAAAQAEINRIFGDISLSFSQHPSSHFLEKSPRDQLEFLEHMLFKSGSTISEIKNRFKENKSSLDKAFREVGAKITLVEEFIRKLGPVADVVAVDHSDARAMKRELAFIENRLHLYKKGAERRAELQQKRSQLRARLAELDRLNCLHIPYTLEELYAHIAAKKELDALQPKHYQEYTQQECLLAIEEYREDLSLLQSSLSIQCPACQAHLTLEEKVLKITEPAQPDAVKAILEGLDATSVQDGIDLVQKQIRLFETYAERRAQIEKITTRILSDIQDEIASIKALKGVEQLDYEKLYIDKEIVDIEARLTALDAKMMKMDIKDDEARAFSIRQKLDDSSVFEQRLRDNETRKEYANKLAELEKVNAQANRRLTALQRAFAIFLETEQEYIKGSLELLCSKVNAILKEFFVGQPPQINLNIEATTGGVKSLKVNISYRDHSYTYPMLSSGEKTRFNLAFLLAFSHLQNSRLLLLDEATKHLDATTASRVFDYIEREFNGTVISIEHQPSAAHHSLILPLVRKKL